MQKHLIIVALITLTALGGCKKQVQEKVAAPVPVVAAKVQSLTVPVEIRTFGTVEPYSTVLIRSQVAGVLEKVHFSEGQIVKKGDPLFTIDPRPFQARLKLAQANLAKDQAQLENAQKEAKRIAELFAKGFASQDDNDSAATEVSTFAASIDADKAAAEDAALKVEYCFINSPCDGRTGNLLAHAGNSIKENDTQLLVINQVEPINVSFSVTQQQFSLVQAAAAKGELDVTASFPDIADVTLTGKLTFSDNSISTDTGTIKLKAVFANADRKLWPGQFVNTSIVLSYEPNAAVVPAEAVQRNQQGFYAFVIKADNTVESRQVEQSRLWKSMAVVSKGLAPGETVITDGHLRVTPGMKVEPSMQPAEIAAANEVQPK